MKHLLTSTIDDLVARVKGLTESELKVLRIKVVSASGKKRGAYFITPWKEIRITTNATEYDFYHELGHFFEYIRYGAKFGMGHSKARESFANSFMRTWGKPHVKIFKGMGNEAVN